MKNLLRISLLSFFILSIGSVAVAQRNIIQVEANAGLLSAGSGIRFFTSKKTAIHTIFSIDYGFTGYRVAAIYEEHQPVAAVSGLTWYAGAGLQTGYRVPGLNSVNRSGNDAVVFSPDERVEPDATEPGKVAVGATVIFGMQYHFGNGPISLSADLKPFVNFFNRDSKLFDGSLRLAIDL